MEQANQMTTLKCVPLAALILRRELEQYKRRQLMMKTYQVRLRDGRVFTIQARNEEQARAYVAVTYKMETVACEQCAVEVGMTIEVAW